MIAHLRGRVSARDAETVVVDVQGIGYLVHIADPGAVPPQGQTVEMHTSLQVREDALDLYGFPDRDSRELFEQLMDASGVGPKLALAALRTHRPTVLRRAITGEDLETLKAVPGIGSKSAERLVLELRDRLTAPPGEGVADPTGGRSAAAGVLGEVREALQALGYTAGEIQDATAELTVGPDGSDGGDAEVAELVRRALRELGGSPTGARS